MKRFSSDKSVKVSFALVLTLLLSSNAWAEIYMYIDKQGKQYFSQKKENKNYKLVLLHELNILPKSSPERKENSYSISRKAGNKALQQMYHPLIVQAARKYQLEPAFIHAVIATESSYQRQAISSAGAKGLMQLMPQTAIRFGVNDPFDAEQSIHAGTKYLHDLLKEFKTKKLALAAYNAGEGAVRRYNNQIPPYPETQKYVSKVMTFYQQYKGNL